MEESNKYDNRVLDDTEMDDGVGKEWYIYIHIRSSSSGSK